MDATVMRLECPNNELGQPAQLQAARVEPAPTAARDLSEEPAQMDPDVQQKEAHGDQHEAVSRVLRRRPATDLTATAIAAFDAKAAAVLSACLTGRPVEMDKNED